MEMPKKFFIMDSVKEMVKDVDQEIINLAYDAIDPVYGSYYASERTNEMYNDDFLIRVNILNSFE